MAEAPPDPQPAAPGGPGRWTPLRTAIATSLVLVTAALGVGGYLIGSRTGPDLETVRAEGFTAGAQIGAKAGDRRGAASGYELGKRLSYGEAYREAFRASYQAAFREAGLPTPSFTDIDLGDEDASKGAGAD